VSAKIPEPYVPVTWQLRQAGILQHLSSLSSADGGLSMMGKIRPEAVDQVIAALASDDRFANGVFYQLHRKDFDPSAVLTDFRSHPGTLGDGSLQVVVERTTGIIYADVDRFSPYADLVNVIGHLFGEVLWNRVKRARRA
jgi:hypothetical protein